MLLLPPPRNYYKKFSLETIEGEQWKPIKGYEGLYEISSLGRVMSLEKKHPCRNRIWNKKIKKQSINVKGYLNVCLSKKSVIKTHRIHKLVATHFIDNVKNKFTINHKWGVKTNNMVSDLEWATQTEQCRHIYSVLCKVGNNHRAGKLGHECPISIPVVQCLSDGTPIKIWAGASEAARELGYGQAMISMACRNKRNNNHSYKEYTWRFI